MGMIAIIKQAGLDAVNASNPLVIEFGTILDDNLTIRVEQKKTLPKEFFTVPESLTPYVININGTDFVIRKGLNQGDGVVLLRLSNAKYLILDKVG